MDEIKKFVESQSFQDVRFIQRVMEPLRVHYGIDHFWQFRMDEQGTFFYTGNDPDRMNVYLDLNLHKTNAFFAHPNLYPQMRILEEIAHDDAYLNERKMIRQKVNLYNHYLILRKPTPNVCEGFGFASITQNNCIVELASQSPEIFEAFVDYYLQKTEKMQNRLYDNRVFVRDFYGPAFTTKTDLHRRLHLLQQKRTLFFSTILPEKSCSLEQLTPREKDCILCYLKGLTAEETARAFSISKRTVESYFENIKQKLNLTSKRDLFKKVDPLHL